MAVAGLAGAMSAIGTVTSMAGSFITYSGQQQAEKRREMQMELEASRGRREQIRKAQAARASATATAYNQGAGYTSALSGGIAQITNEAGRNVAAINQDEQIGKGIFDANRKASFGQMVSATGSGISSLGSVFSSNTSTFKKLGYA